MKRLTPAAPVSPTVPNLRDALRRAIDRREDVLARDDVDALRLFGDREGIDGLFIDRYAQGLTLIAHRGTPGEALAHADAAHAVLETVRTAGLDARAVYLKPFVRDRAALGGVHPDALRNPTPAAGEPLPDELVVREHDLRLAVRLYDGFSTGLFLDQRPARRWMGRVVAERARATGRTPEVLNTFAYTCAFGVAAARAGARTTNNDVSPRYLDWGERNYALSDIETPEQHRFVRQGTFEQLDFAQRKGIAYDLIVLDPPTFASADKRRGVAAWSAARDYPALIDQSARVLAPGGVVYASTNCRDLCAPGALRDRIAEGLADRTPAWLDAPTPDADFALAIAGFAAEAFTLE